MYVYSLKRLGLPTAMAAVSVFLAAPATAERFQGLGDLPGGIFRSEANAVSANGLVVVGTSHSSGDAGAFRWTADSGIQALPGAPMGTILVEATGVSANGSVVVGRAFSSVTNSSEAFRWTGPAGPAVGLGDLPGGLFDSRANSVSADGLVVVGTGRSVNGQEAFWWTPAGGMQPLVGVPAGVRAIEATAISADGSVIVGYSFSPTPSPGATQAFRWTAPSGPFVTLGDLRGGGVFSKALGVSADGSVIVGVSINASSSGLQGFRWTSSSGMQALAGTGGEARGVSANGSLVVGSATAPAPTFGLEAVVWDQAGVKRTLKSVMQTDFAVDMTTWFPEMATAITPNGKVIIGQGFRSPDGRTEGFRASLFNTLIGAPVRADLGGGTATPGGVSVTFSSVTADGETTLTPDSSCAPPPSGFKVIRPPPPGPPEQTCFDLATTASFEGPIQVCFNYTGWLVGNETNLQLRHWDGSGWELPIGGTFSLDTVANVICGSFDSLSPFAIFEPDNQPPAVSCNAPVVLWSPNHELIDASSAFAVDDPDGDIVALSIRVFSDETEIPETGDGTGRHAPDFKNELFPGGRGLLVRSERRNPQNGRFYIFVITADDGNGGVSTAVCAAAVCPHDQNQSSLDDVLAQASAAAATIDGLVRDGGELPPPGLYEHGLAEPLGPHQ